MLYTEEQIQRANERSISEFFRQEGYSCKKVRSETHIAGFGGFYVKDSTIPNQFYIHSRQTGGTGLFSCLMKVLDMPFRKRCGLHLTVKRREGTETIKHIFRKATNIPFPNPNPNS